MSEKKDNAVYVNNSDEMFLNGVLYGMKFCIELVKSEKLNCDKNNGIATMLNETLDASWHKMFQVFKLMFEHKRVADLDKMISDWNVDEHNLEGKKALEKCVDEMWRTIKK